MGKIMLTPSQAAEYYAAKMQAQLAMWQAEIAWKAAKEALERTKGE